LSAEACWPGLLSIVQYAMLHCLCRFILTFSVGSGCQWCPHSETLSHPRPG